MTDNLLKKRDHHYNFCKQPIYYKKKIIIFVPWLWNNSTGNEQYVALSFALRFQFVSLENVETNRI